MNDDPNDSTNDGKADKQPNAESCQAFCHTKNEPYFKWLAPGHYLGADYYNSCWCKASTINVATQSKAASGATCEGKVYSQQCPVYILFGMLSHIIFRHCRGQMLHGQLNQAF